MKIYFILLFSFASCYAPTDTEFLAIEKKLESLKTLRPSVQQLSELDSLKLTLDELLKKIACDFKKLRTNQANISEFNDLQKELQKIVTLQQKLYLLISPFKKKLINFKTIENLNFGAHSFNPFVAPF